MFGSYVCKLTFVTHEIIIMYMYACMLKFVEKKISWISET